MIGRRPLLGALGATAAASTLGRVPTAAAAVPFGLQAAWVDDAEFIGYYVALEKGWYRDEGLDLTYHPGGPEITPENSLLSGKAQVALTSPDTSVNMVVEQGAPLKIIGAQYQKNPLSIMSLSENPIRTPLDLIGKTLAVPPFNLVSVDAMLRLNGIDARAVRIVPYSYDLAPLLAGEVDASTAFITNEPFALQQAGKDVVTFLLYDFGFSICNDTVVVTEQTLVDRRADLIGFLRASRKGWQENFRFPGAWPLKLVEAWFQGSGRTVEQELYFNLVQQPLIEHPDGIFAMTEEGITKNIAALAEVGIDAPREVFDASLLEEI